MCLGYSRVERDPSGRTTCAAEGELRRPQAWVRLSRTCDQWRTNMHQLKDLMSRDVKVISPDMTIHEAARTMRDGDFGMLPVSEDDRMIGAISDRDIAIRAVADGKGPGTKVREIMSAGICWAYDDDTVDHAAKLMSEQQVRRLPVVDHDKRLVGIVSLGDFAVDSSQIRPAAEALAKISEPS